MIVASLCGQLPGRYTDTAGLKACDF